MARRGHPGGLNVNRRGTKMLTPWGLGIEVASGAAANRIGALIEGEFQVFNESLQANFDLVVLQWMEKIFTPSIQNAVRATTWVRSGMLQRTVAKFRSLPTNIGNEGRRYVIGADFPSDATEYQGIGLEMGREAGGAPKNRYYLVPLASWVMKKGRAGKERKYMTHAEIKRDLSQPGTFMPKQEFDVKGGQKARIIFLMHKNRRRFKKAKRTGKFMKLGPKRESKLSEIATAMYLAMKGTTGIYGAAMKDRKVPKQPFSPLAAKFGLVKSRNSPKWFTHAAGNSLAALYRSVQNVKFKQEALGFLARPGAAVPIGEANEEGEFVGFNPADTAERIMQDVIEEMRAAGYSEADIKYWTQE